MPETLHTSDEKRLLGYIKQAVDLVDNQGLSPDEAVEKIATADRLGPGMIHLVCRAYNNGRQLGQWRSGGSILDKLASFPLADAERVIARVYPARADTPKEAFAKAAFDTDYLLPPSWAADGDRAAAARRDLPGMTKAAGESCGGVPDPKKRKKKAEDVGEPADRMRKAYGRYERAKRAHEEARRHAFACEQKLMSKVAELVAYFRQPDYARLPFEQVDYAARRYFGAPAAELLKLAHARACLREKAAMSDEQLLACKKIPAVYKRACDRAAEPYTLIAAALRLGFEVNQARHWVKEAEELRDRVAGATIRPFGQPSSGAKAPSRPTSGNLLGGGRDKAAGLTLNPLQLGIEASVIGAGDVLGGGYLHRRQKEEEAQDKASYEDTLGDDRVEALKEIARQEAALKPKAASLKSILPEKRAIFGVAFGNAVGSGLARGLGDMPKAKGDLIKDDWLELEDPKHLNEMRKIKTNAMLASLLTDPDDPISGHEPDKVLKAYNEIAATAPRVADNPATLKPILRKRLAGHTEPFEAKELVDIEKGLRDVKNVPPSTNSMVAAPEDLLG